MRKSDPNDHGLFVRVDQPLSSVGWRLSPDDGSGALSVEQTTMLSEKFALEMGALRELSAALAFTLDPKNSQNWVPVSRATAAARGATDLQQALRATATARFRVREASMTLNRL